MQIDPPNFINLYNGKIESDWKIIFKKQKKEFNVHKLFLSASSDYFSAFLVSSGSCHNMKDSQTLIDSFVKSSCLNCFERFFIPYIYHCKVELTDDNFIPVLQIASTWRFEKLLKQLSSYSITTQNCLPFIVLSQQKSGFFNTPNLFYKKLVEFAKSELPNLRNRVYMSQLEPSLALELFEGKDYVKQSVSSNDLSRWVNKNIDILVSSKDYFERFRVLVKPNVTNVIAFYNVSKLRKNELLMDEYGSFISNNFLEIKAEEYGIMNPQDLLRFLKNYKSSGENINVSYESFNKIFEIVENCLNRFESENEGEIEEEDEDEEENRESKLNSINSVKNELWNCIDFNFLSYENILKLIDRSDISIELVKKSSKLKILSLINQTKSLFEELNNELSLTKIVSVSSNLKINGVDLKKHLEWNQCGNSFISAPKEKYAYVDVSFKVEVNPTKYYLRSSASKYTLKNWKFYGIKNKKLYLLSSHENDLTIKDAQTIGSFPIRTNMMFKAFRIQQCGENWGGDLDFGIDGFKIEGFTINFSSFFEKLNKFLF